MATEAMAAATWSGVRSLLQEGSSNNSNVCVNVSYDHRVDNPGRSGVAPRASDARGATTDRRRRLPCMLAAAAYNWCLVPDGEFVFRGAGSWHACILVMLRRTCNLSAATAARRWRRRGLLRGHGHPGHVSDLLACKRLARAATWCGTPMGATRMAISHLCTPYAGLGMHK
eukprot:353590-Chlamydomonas_euryale.AAC.5